MDIDLLISQYGPWAVFLLLMLSGIGIPLGEDIITIPAGVLIAHGKLDFWPTLALAYVGVILADILWFYICGRYGTRLLHRRWFKRMIHPRRLLQAKHQVEERGVRVMILSRFVPSSRTTAITVSGLLHMKMWKFVLVEVVCVAITAPMQIGIGFLIGKGITTQDTASLILWIVGVAIVVATVPAVISWIIRYRASKRRLPRAKARWLRRFRPRRKESRHAKKSAVQTADGSGPG